MSHRFFRRPKNKFSPCGLLVGAFALLFFTSAAFAFQPDVPQPNAPRAPVLLLTPERFAVAPPAPTRSASTRDPRAEVSEAMIAEDSVFDALLTPFVAETKRRRAEMARTDPDLLLRIDPVLNEGRINFLLFGYGETHEPPFTERAFIGSHTIISYHLRARQADIISFTHDIRAPEVERELAKRSEAKITAARIDSAYPVGGFRLQRKMMEDATGLAIDFQVAFKDAALARFVDKVFEGVTVDAPMEFDVHPFYLDGVKYPGGHFSQGVQKLTGTQVIQFIKTVPVAEGLYDPMIEHNARKSYVFAGLLQALTENYADRGLWLRGSAFAASEYLSGAVAFDFDPLALVVNNIGRTLPRLKKSLAADSAGALTLPKINQSKYIVDPAHGDGGVQWVNANAAVNPITQKDIDAGIYPTLAMEVPYTANPYGDLVTGYWGSVRALVRETLLGR